MQTNPILQVRPVSVRTITRVAMLTAIIFIMTFIPRIPIPFGYAHLGDAVIFLTLLFAERRQSAAAASLGSALSDMIGGFPLWIVPTLLIKWIMVDIVFVVARSNHGFFSIFSGRVILAFMVSAAWMVLSYTAFGALLFGSAAAGMAMLPGLIGEGIINIAVALGVGTVLQKFHFNNMN
jgi:uncharacterized membrane protein